MNAMSHCNRVHREILVHDRSLVSPNILFTRCSQQVCLFGFSYLYFYRFLGHFSADFWPSYASCSPLSAALLACSLPRLSIFFLVIFLPTESICTPNITPRYSCHSPLSVLLFCFPSLQHSSLFRSILYITCAVISCSPFYLFIILFIYHNCLFYRSS